MVQRWYTIPAQCLQLRMHLIPLFLYNQPLQHLQVIFLSFEVERDSGHLGIRTEEFREKLYLVALTGLVHLLLLLHHLFSGLIVLLFAWVYLVYLTTVCD